jgi:Ca2+:H+ antiporter
MTLFFSILEVSALTLAVLIATIIASDGESNWLEGAQLLAVYLIIALGFFFLSPASGEATRRLLLGA